VNSTEHLSQQTLELLARSELSESDRVSSGLHLSYCPICRSRSDELALKLVAQRMWTTSPVTDEAHINIATFESFWFTELVDETVLKTISHHCIVCVECRNLRDLARSNVESKRTIFATLILAVIRKVWDRRWLSGLAVGALGILSAIALMFALSIPEHQTINTLSPTPTPEARPSTSPPIAEPKQELTPPNDVLAKVQTIDLAKVPDGDDSRSPDVPTQTKPDVTVVASNSSPTALRIVLPHNSKKGVYHVSIRDEAFLGAITHTRGVSRNGRILNLSVNLSHIKNGTYVLRLEREAPGTSHREYVGDYEVAVTRVASMKRTGNR